MTRLEIADHLCQGHDGDFESCRRGASVRVIDAFGDAWLLCARCHVQFLDEVAERDRELAS